MLRKIPGGSSQVATVAGGTALGQLFVLAATPMLARLYSPAQFGEYAAFLAICNVFTSVACLRYDAAVNATEEENVSQVFTVACFAAAATSIFVFLFASLAAGRSWIDQAVGRHLDAWWIAAAALLCGIYQAASTIAVRRGQFVNSGLLRAGQPFVFSLAATTTPIGLIGSCLLGYLIALPVSARYAMTAGSVSARSLAKAAWRFREFPVMSLPTSILDAVSLAMPIWFIASAYSSTNAGNYAQVQRLLGAPLILLAIGIGQVFIKHAGDIVRSGQSARPLLRNLAGYLFGGACALTAAILLFFSPILSIFLGTNWRTDPTFLLLVYLPVAVRSCVSPLTGIFIVRQQLRICAIWQAFYFLVTSAAFIGLAGRVSFEQLLMAYCLTETVCYAVYLYLADRVAGQQCAA